MDDMINWTEEQIEQTLKPPCGNGNENCEICSFFPCYKFEK